MTQNRPQNDIPLSVALLAFVVVGAAYFYLNVLRFDPEKTLAIQKLLIEHSIFWGLSALAFMCNAGFIGVFLSRNVNLERQGSKLQVLKGEPQKWTIARAELWAGIGSAAAYFSTRRSVAVEIGPLLLRVVSVEAVSFANAVLSLNLAMALFFILRLTLPWFGRLKFGFSSENELEKPKQDSGELILGTTSGGLRDASKDAREEWVTIPSRGVHGGIFISGSIGSGKTQGTVLRYIRQLVAEPMGSPSILAIDPKGTFLREAEKIIRDVGQGDRIVKISLKGNVSFNPVFIENPLRDSKFASLAEMVRCAAVNFMGKSSDSPFWDVSSSHLVRNTIAYLAAVQGGYFTLLDVYRTIVRASKENLADDLKRKLSEQKFTEEEAFNIRCAIEYFESEYSQLEDRVRTGIVATSTAFVNQFQEFAANRIFCPKKENLTIQSMEDFVREGKILLFDIQQPGLARSMGTFVKLHYEQAVLNLLGELKEQEKPFTSALIIDEYQDVVTCGGGGTIGDDTFMAKARESKPAVIVATQSLSSLMNTVGKERPALELVQNFRTRIACHSSDLETIRNFQALAGKEVVDYSSHSYSETAQGAKRNFIAGGFDSKTSSLNESISRQTRAEDVLTGKEFSRLKTFESFAQVYDGVETRFLKLYLKPNFLHSINTKHETILEMMRVTKKGGAVSWVKRLARNIRAVSASLLLAGNVQAVGIPTVCSVASSPAFPSCLDLTISGCTCGWPPHPCAMISYYVPQTFIEVWPDQKTSYFTAIPGAAAQLSKVPPMPFGAEADDDTQSFHARTISVPLAGLTFRLMPAGGTRMEKMCFDGMSEDYGTHWKTGKGDLTQPQFLAWSLSPKACLLVGAATSVSGSPGSSVSGDSAMCGFPIPNLGILPPSSHPACNGWGVFYPRYGTYSGPASMTGALMIASRIKSLNAEVLRTMPSGPDEKWQMIYPQSSSCFREGQNVGLLETVKNARETMRLANGKLKGYLFVIWKRTYTCKELPTAIQAKAAALAIPAACRGAP
ncbi:MAG: type IV secretory system conjugative DNA transfer family protein [Pseudobdellovibrionaceae bacterium]